MSDTDSDSGYTAIDLDSPNTETDLGIEIVDADVEEVLPEIVDESDKPVPKRTAAPAAEEADEEEDEEEAEPEAGGRKKLTRAQRLKNARDRAEAARRAAEERAAAAEAKLAKYAKDAEEGAAIGLDLVLQNINDKIKGLRAEFNSAMDNGDRDKLWDVQRELAALETQKEQATRERRAYPTRGGEAQQQAPTTTTTQARPQEQISGTSNGAQPTPRAREWAADNAEWWGKDAKMTRRALRIDADLVDDGYNPDEADYWEELDARLAKAFPDKFEAPKPEAKPRARSTDPTVQSRGGVPATGNKITVKITAADRQMAEELGLTIEAYAKQKARLEKTRAQGNTYTEIFA